MRSPTRGNFLRLLCVGGKAKRKEQSAQYAKRKGLSVMQMILFMHLSPRF